MVPLLLFAAAIGLAYRRYGVAGLWFVAAGVSLLGASGVALELALGPAWSWNFGHHDIGYAVGALSQGILFAVVGMTIRSRRRRAA